MNKLSAGARVRLLANAARAAALVGFTVALSGCYSVSPAVTDNSYPNVL